MSLRLKHQLYKELIKYSFNKKGAKQRFKELMAIIRNNDELIKVIAYYKTLNTLYK